METRTPSPSDLAQIAEGAPEKHDDDRQKKLWFDYVKTLNERHLQAAQRSGVTNYLLVTALAALLFRYLPHLSYFLQSPDYPKGAVIFFVLQTDFFAFVALALITVSLYCAQGIEHRVFPEHRRRVSQIILGVMLVLTTSLAVAHVSILWRISPASQWVRRGLILLATYWLLNTGVVAGKEGIKIRKSLKHKVPIPRFSAPLLEPTLLISLISGCIYGLMALVPAACLILYVKTLSTDWIEPWKAASVSLGFCFLVLYMLNRAAFTVGQNSYLELERDIVLQNLEVEEIRTRFVNQLIGPDAAQWLDDVLAEFTASNEVRKKNHESSRKQLQEIRQIDVAYSAERKARMEKVLKESHEVLDKHSQQLDQFRFRTKLFFEGYLGPKERKALEKWKLKFFAATEDATQISKDADDLISEIRAITDQMMDMSTKSRV
jgi:hypothetical protein